MKTVGVILLPAESRLTHMLTGVVVGKDRAAMLQVPVQNQVCLVRPR